MTRTRHLHRSAVIATATAIFAVAGAGTAALAVGNAEVTATPVASVEVVPTIAPTPAEIAAPAKATAAAIAKAASVRLVAVKAPAKPVVAKVEKAAAKPAATAQVRKPTAKPAAAKPAAAASKPAAKKSSVIYIRSYVNAPGSQAAIDKCNLVLWSSSPMWLAAHNYCGFQWMAFVPTGKTVVVTKGVAAGTYVVTGHKRLGRQGGAMPNVDADLVLQTCVGSGTGLTLLQRV